jgi:signal transduction histidine kinase
MIKVKDSGAGIEETDLSKIFDPFYTTKARGTGLGLTVCKEIVTLHGGTLDISSVKGVGTEVKIYLPKKH